MVLIPANENPFSNEDPNQNPSAKDCTRILYQARGSDYVLSYHTPEYCPST